MAVFIKRVYETPSPSDGVRILVDRLWPRGISREKGKIDHWIKAIAPSDDLRRWYNHDPDKWPEFRSRYFVQLDANRPVVEEILEHIRKSDVTFVYSSRETRYNNAVALKEYIAALAE